MYRSVLALISLVFCFAAFSSSQAQEAITPPFGLQWGMTKPRLEELLKGAKARISERRTVAGRERWTVEGLIQTNLRQTVFYFRNDGLVEVELQYQNNDWIDSDYSNFMGQLRVNLERKYGSSKLIARSKNPQGNVVSTLTGYEWVQSGSAIQLVFFSAESASQIFRMVSVHYKAI
jgi:hypothetical protein